MSSITRIPISSVLRAAPGAGVGGNWRPAPDTVVNFRVHTGFRVCNYSCPYCIAGHGEVKEDAHGDLVMDDPTWDEARLRTVVLNLLAQPYRINVRFQVPGEVFLNKRLLRVIQEVCAAPNVKSVNLLTNLSLHRHQYERILAPYEQAKLAFVASFHPTDVSNRDVWIESARWFDERFDFAVVVVGYPALMSTIEENIAWLRGHGLTVFVQPFIGTMDGRDYPDSYSPAERALIGRVMYSRHDREFLLDKAKPGLCYAGSTYFYVTEEGRVLSCGQNPGNEVGDFTRSSELRMSPQPMACPFATCQCDTENLNTVIFDEHYELTGINQHKFRYRFADRARTDPAWSEWNIPYRDGALPVATEA